MTSRFLEIVLFWQNFGHAKAEKGLLLFCVDWFMKCLSFKKILFYCTCLKSTKTTSKNAEKYSADCSAEWSTILRTPKIKKCQYETPYYIVMPFFVWSDGWGMPKNIHGTRTTWACNPVKNKPAVISLVEIYTSGDSRSEVQHHLQNSGNHYFHFTSVKNGWSQWKDL